MMRSIVESSLRFRLLVVALAAATLVIGVAKLRDMPVDVLPEFVPPTVEIQTEALGLSAAEVEQLITVPMEQDLLVGVAFLKDIRSESLPSLSRIFLVFEDGTDLFRARQVVAERLTQAHALPNVSKPPQMLQPLSSTNRVLMIGASSTTLTPIEMGVLARWTIAPRLIGVPGVANVSIWGFKDRQLQVQVDPERLRAKDVTLVQVVESTGNALWFSPLTFVEASTPGTGGFVDTPNQRLGVQHLSTISSASDLAQVRIEDTGDRNLVLGDVASVVEDHQPLIGDAVVGGGSASGSGDLIFVVEKLPDASTLDVTRGLESAIADLRPGTAGVEFSTGVYRPASFIDAAIDNLAVAAIIAALLVALALGAFLFDWRAVLICVGVIPLSLTAGALALWALGSTMNAIVLVGLIAATVLVVDDAVVGVTAATRLLRERRRGGDGMTPAAIVVEATVSARKLTTYATLILALSLLPLLFLDRLAGSFFPDVVGALVLAAVASLLVGLTVTPALATLLLSRASVDREPALTRRLQATYASALSWILARQRWVLLGVTAAIAAAGVSAIFLSSTLLPQFKEQQLLIRWDGSPGTSLSETRRITSLASRELRSIPGVREVGAHVGRAVASDVSANPNAAELWVTIDPDADYGATVAAVNEVVDGYPGLSRTVGTFANERASAVLSAGSDRDLVVRVYGEDSGVLQAQADRVRQTIAGVDGVVDASVELPPVEPTVEVEVDLAAAQQHGIKPGDVRRAAATLLGGLVAGNLFEQQKVFEVVVWGTPETRRSLTSIRQLLVDTPDGGHVRLGEVAAVRIAPNPPVIRRQAVSRYLDVSAGIDGRDRDAVVQDVERRLGDLQFPLEYHTEIQARAGQPYGTLVGVSIGAAIGILLLLQACFGSWRLAALGFLAFPLALTGGVVAAALVDGGAVSFGSAIGLFAIYGLAARNGVRLVDRLRRLERSGVEHGRGLVLQEAPDGLAPTLMTAVAVALAMAPFAIRGDVPGYELAHPLALVVLGGLLTSTLVTLFVIPVLYLGFGAGTTPVTAAAHALAEDVAPTRPGTQPVPTGMQRAVQTEPGT